jgi:hypothetical protein
MRARPPPAKLSPLARPWARGGQEARNAYGTNEAPPDRVSHARRDCSAAGKLNPKVPTMELKDWIAGYGAVTSTLALAWQYYTWSSSRAKIDLIAAATDHFFFNGRKMDGRFIAIEVTNRGRSPTVVRQVGFIIVPRGAVPADGMEYFHPNHAGTFMKLPADVPPAGQWKGFVNFAHMAAEVSGKDLWLNLEHTMGKAPVRQKLTLPASWTAD